YARQGSALRGENQRKTGAADSAHAFRKSAVRVLQTDWPGRPIDAGCSFSFVLVVDVDADGSQQDDALDHLLVIDPDAEDGHDVLHHAHHECADAGAETLADAPRCGGAADEACRDHVQL